MPLPQRQSPSTDRLSGLIGGRYNAKRIMRRTIDCALTPFDVLRSLRQGPYPFALIGEWANGQAILGCNPVEVVQGAEHCLEALDAHLAMEPGCAAQNAFGGGWIGYLGYQVSGHVERVPPPPGLPPVMPNAWLGFYDNVLVYDGVTWRHEALLDETGNNRHETTFYAVLAQLSNHGCSPEPYVLSAFDSTPSSAAHKDAIKETLRYIRAGDIFQANICLRLSADFEGDPLDLYCAGAESLNPLFSAFMRFDQGALASFSPELFLRQRGQVLFTSPIKGTAQRVDNDGGQSATDLLGSSKDHAENLMIVDLMRNDLGRVCLPGTVEAPAVARIEAHPGVWHLVSDVKGMVPTEIRPSDLVRYAFPPGSVTGAPKVRAMEIIHELESAPREIYTGAIGYVSPLMGVEWNVAIRSFEFHDQKVWLGVGGGIVSDSDAEHEYAECLVKARPLIEAIGSSISNQSPSPKHFLRPNPAMGVFETILAVDGQTVWAADHLERLERSIQELFGECLPVGIELAIGDCVRHTVGLKRIRVEVKPRAGSLSVEIDVVDYERPRSMASLTPVLVPDGLGRHKWSDRRLLEVLADEQGLPANCELLLIGGDGNVLETSVGNVFIRCGETVLTPPLDGRILPGTARERVIAAVERLGFVVRVEPISLERLAAADEVLQSNALRFAQSVKECRGVATWTERGLGAEVRDRLESKLSDKRRARPRVPVARGRQAARDITSFNGEATGSHLVIVDNFDSFTYNIVQRLGGLGIPAKVVRNNETLEDVFGSNPTAIIISPGPCSPTEAGISNEVIEIAANRVPLLGICLGHQCIAHVFSGEVRRADEVMHGKTSPVFHDGLAIYRDLPSPLKATRYHSLVVGSESLGSEILKTAWTEDQVLMGLRHRSYPLEGVQFHPESVMTDWGVRLLQNFVGVAKDWWNTRSPSLTTGVTV